MKLRYTWILFPPSEKLRLIRPYFKLFFIILSTISEEEPLHLSYFPNCLLFYFKSLIVEVECQQTLYQKIYTHTFVLWVIIRIIRQISKCSSSSENFTTMKYFYHFLERSRSLNALCHPYAGILDRTELP